MSLKSDSPRKLRKEKAKWDLETPQDYEEMEDAFLKARLQSKEPTIKGQVRITGGSVKNFTIDIPKNTRPLTDRVKVRIFDILSKDIANKSVLDLYAGSGSFGLEALSRGAKHATFVDASKHAIRAIESNLKKTGFTQSAEVIREKAVDFIKETQKSSITYDIIFMDPPFKLYNTKKVFKMEEIINGVGNFLPGNRDKSARFKGALIVKHPRHYPKEKLNLRNLKEVETYQFGLNSITLYIVAI